MSEEKKLGSNPETTRYILLIQAAVILETMLEEAAKNPAVWNVGDWETLLGSAEIIRKLAETERHKVIL